MHPHQDAPFFKTGSLTASAVLLLYHESCPSQQDPVKCPGITIAVQNIEDTLKNVKKMGGELVREKMQVGDMGYAAYFKDTEGNVIGLWQNIS